MLLGAAYAYPAAKLVQTLPNSHVGAARGRRAPEAAPRRKGAATDAVHKHNVHHWGPCMACASPD